VLPKYIKHIKKYISEGKSCTYQCSSIEYELGLGCLYVGVSRWFSTEVSFSFIYILCL